ADLGRAAWIGKRAIADGSHDIGFDEVVGFQRLEVEIDGNHPLLSAIWVGNADSRYTDQPDANLVQSDVEDLLLGKFWAADSELENRNRGRAVLDDQWRSGSRWKLSQNGLRHGRQVRHRGRGIRTRLKENFDYTEAVIGGRFNVFDIVDRGRERSLLAVNNSLRDLIGRQTGITPDHTDHRDIDGG